jgi:hypothetical protein
MLVGRKGVKAIQSSFFSSSESMSQRIQRCVAPLVIFSCRGSYVRILSRLIYVKSHLSMRLNELPRLIVRVAATDRRKRKRYEGLSVAPGTIAFDPAFVIRVLGRFKPQGALHQSF